MKQAERWHTAPSRTTHVRVPDADRAWRSSGAGRGGVVHCTMMGIATWLLLQFSEDWGATLSMAREGATGWQVQGRWSVKPASQKMLRAVGGLSSDLQLLWNGFMLITARRIGFSSGAGADPDDISSYNGTSLLVFAVGPSSFDLIVSKYGYGDSLKRNHHFFQWQARSGSFQNMVKVDDYEGEDGLTLYVVA
jgi:hypothetical protein